jgi:hypothetical protein
MNPEIMYVSQSPDFSEVIIFYALDAVSFRNNVIEKNMPVSSNGP